MSSQKVALEIVAEPMATAHVPIQTVKAVQEALIARFQQCREDWKGVRAKANDDMKSEFVNAKRNLGKEEKTYKTTVRHLEKEEREKAYKAFHSTKSHELYDPVIKRFERRYYYGFMTLGSLMWELEDAIKQFDCTPGFGVESDLTKIRIGDEFGRGSVHVGNVFKNHLRFELIHRGVPPYPSVYRNRTNGKSYVEDRNGIYVPRYLIRNLSPRDVPDQGLKSRDGQVPRTDDFAAAVLRHLRAAQQGHSYFISATTTTSPIYGSTGKNFLTGDVGQVLVDAAEIPQNNIVDVHSPRAIELYITTDRIDWDLPFSETDVNYQRMAAARDTIRTREILIHDFIPRDAVVSVRELKKGDRSGPWTDSWTAVTIRSVHGPARDMAEITARQPQYLPG
jgi:hypothetical protein